MIAPAKPPEVTVVIPTLEEETTLPVCLERLAGQRGRLEVVVADGGSRDRTRDVARAAPGVRVVRAARGRGCQMNAGARAARGAILWFLHADAEPPRDAVQEIRRALADGRVTAGVFRLAVSSSRRAYRIVEWGGLLRTRLLGRPYGDQGIFLRRETFEAVGGFPPIAVGEDLRLVRKLVRRGRIRYLDLALPVSARRWEKRGIVRTTLANWAVAALLEWGGRPDRLARLRGAVTAGRTVGGAPEEDR